MNLTDRIAERVLVGDGAMGTELQRAGLPLGESGEAWALQRPDVLQAIHEAYLEAGSDLILTNSFGANPWVLGRYGLADQHERIAREAATIARRAAGTSALVLGDIGPCGGFVRPLGDVDRDELGEAFRRQAAALLEGGADGIIIETMSALEETLAAVEAARRAGAPVVVASMAFDELPNGAIRTMMGVSPEQAARQLADAGADLLGANCGTRMKPEGFASVVRAFRATAPLPVIVQANAGSPELVEGRAVYRLGPEAFAAGMASVLAAGAAILGGCCGTTPAHIHALRRMCDESGKAAVYRRASACRPRASGRESIPNARRRAGSACCESASRGFGEKREGRSRARRPCPTTAGPHPQAPEHRRRTTTTPSENASRVPPLGSSKCSIFRSSHHRLSRGCRSPLANRRRS